MLVSHFDNIISHSISHRNPSVSGHSKSHIQSVNHNSVRQSQKWVTWQISSQLILSVSRLTNKCSQLIFHGITKVSLLVPTFIHSVNHSLTQVNPLATSISHTVTKIIQSNNPYSPSDINVSQ